MFFFFQAEDGIRDYKVTGVQTCALPICSGHDGDDELKRAAGLKGAMGKVAMVPGGDKEHPHVKQRQADNQVRPVKTQKKYRNTCQVNGKKRKRADQGDPCAIAEGNRCGCHTEVSFECGPGMPTAVSASVEEGPAAAAPGKTSLTIGAPGEGVKPRLKACCPSGAWHRATSLLEWRLFLRYAKWSLSQGNEPGRHTCSVLE